MQTTLEELVEIPARARALYPGSFEGLQPTDIQALIAIKLTPGLTATELAPILALSIRTVFTALNDLQAAGLVATDRDPADKRRRLQTITPEGEALVARFLGDLSTE